MERSVRIDWPAAVFYAESEQEKFTELKIITLKSYYLTKVNERVLDSLWVPPKKRPHKFEEKFFDIIWQKSIDIINEGKVHVRQFVEIDGECVTLCIDVEEITENEIIPALDTLATIGVTHKGKVEFGPLKSFKTHELRTYG